MPSDGYTLPEFSGIFEKRTSRKDLVQLVREMILHVKPNGGIRNIADYDWHSIHTTNYDTIVEDVFKKKGKGLRKFSSNFDFGGTTPPGTTKLYKFHGTIESDVSDGHNSRIIITMEDYEILENYRENLYDQLKADINNSSLLIIGHSLADEDLRTIVRRAVRIKQEMQITNTIYLLLYTRDEARAELYEDQGVKVCFSGVDDFFLELAKAGPSVRKLTTATEDIISHFPMLQPTTFDIDQKASGGARRFSAVYSGSPCDYADIRAGYSFERSASPILKEKIESGLRYITILGASGVGKTTLARQVALLLSDVGWQAWEHNSDRALIADEWRRVASELRSAGKKAILVLDDAYLYLSELNKLVDFLAVDQDKSLHLIITSAKNHWKPRFKSANLISRDSSLITTLSRLDNAEISRLLQLVEDQPEIRRLVDIKFRGFSSQEKKRRLLERCGRDFFVCMKNIFENDSFDRIIIKEYSSVKDDVRSIYKYICALETLGVVVHRQVVIRILHVHASSISSVLENLEGLVEEYEIDRKNGVYGWKGRHQVISNIISKNQFSDQDEINDLLKSVVANISPTYDVEIRTLRQLCSPEMGIRKISNLDNQNELLRILISTAPRERVPRHRLISNLINQGNFTDAEAEIRVFEGDLGSDGPIRRYKVRISLGRSMQEDQFSPEERAKYLNNASSGARLLAVKSPQDTHCLRLFGDVAIEVLKKTGSYETIDEALDMMRAAEAKVDDPDITRLIRSFSNRMTVGDSVEFDILDVEDVDIQMEDG